MQIISISGLSWVWSSSKTQ